MFRFGFAIYGLLRKYKRTTFDLAEACGYNEASIYDWRYGRGGDAPSPGHIIKLARAFAKTRKEVQENHLSLLSSHLLDDCCGPGAPFLNVEVLPKALPIVASAWSLHPTRRRSELDLEHIRKHIWYDAALQESVRELARPLRGKPIPSSLNQDQKSPL